MTPAGGRSQSRGADLSAVVEIEHEDPRQLLVTLVGPDGTAVKLHDRSGAAEHPLAGERRIV